MAQHTVKKSHSGNAPQKHHTDRRTLFVRVVASVCALLMILSALAVLLIH